MRRAETMRAAIVTNPGRVEIAEVEKPRPGPNEVRIRMEGSGMCASSNPTFEGRAWFTYPLEPGKPGHEGWGVVDAVGEHVTTIQPGERVAALTYRAFAEYDLADAEAVVRLPRELDGQSFPGEALGCALNIFRRARIEAGQTVAVIGVGFLGALSVRLASRAGARVVALSRRASSLDLAARSGADLTVPFGEVWDVAKRVKAWAGADGVDRVIEAVGEQRPLDLATELVATGGRLVIAGYHQDGPRQVNMQLWNWRGIDVINAHERDRAVYVRGIREALDLVVSRHVDPTPLYTHVYDLADIAAAFEAQRARPEGFVKALVRIR